MTKDIDPRFAAAHYQDGRDLKADAPAPLDLTEEPTGQSITDVDALFNAVAVSAVPRVGPEGWKRLAESQQALAETERLIREIDEQYGLGEAADGVPPCDGGQQP